MSGVSPVGLLALVAKVILYTFEDRSPLAALGFSAACAVAAVSDFVLGRLPFGIVALAFSAVSFRRWLGRRRLDGHI